MSGTYEHEGLTDVSEKLWRAAEISARKKAVGDLHHVLDILNRVLAADEADTVQVPQEGCRFQVRPYRPTTSYSYISPNPSWGAGPNYTERPEKRPYPRYAFDAPFTADQLIAVHFGVMAVNLQDETCIVIDVAADRADASVAEMPAET